MKITEIKTQHTNIKAKITKNDTSYMDEFNQTMTSTEKQAELYTEWEPKRLGQLIEAFIKQYKSWCTTEENFKSNLTLHLAHTVVELLGHGKMEIHLDFDGTKETLRHEKFKFEICTSNITELVPVNDSMEPKTTVSMTAEEGDPEELHKYTSFYTQHEKIGRAYKSLAQFITTKTQHTCIRLLAMLVMQAEIASKMNAQTVNIKISGLSSDNNSLEQKEFLDNTLVSILGTKTEIYFDNVMSNASTMLN